ncbi:aspartic peptidase domain-containing protein [Mycena rosella]|uniref:Aspartic peptidase domain-containing protein n=1 Tax=Mycena rosella TaxID=1033263 RepID=A0AAD7D0W2_MYCRO|nr:aspartic peptidase domain-containing protein [Mycena rosella]
MQWTEIRTTFTFVSVAKIFNLLGSCHSGEQYTDQVALGPKLVIKDQSVGVANQADQMNGLGGILGESLSFYAHISLVLLPSGIGPVDLTTGTTMPDSAGGVPTVTDQLLKQGLISTECIGIYYEPTTTANAANGCLSFGGPDSSKYTGEHNYVPITKSSPASNYWGIDQSISYGGQEIMASCGGIADTGTTLVMLPTSVLNAYKEATGAVEDPSTQLLTVTEDQYSNMQSMMFKIGVPPAIAHHDAIQNEYELTKNAQIWPRSMNDSLGVPSNKFCLIFADMGNVNVGDGLCFINGFTFLQRFYSVYDVSNSQVGFATTQYTQATTN